MSEQSTQDQPQEQPEVEGHVARWKANEQPAPSEDASVPTDGPEVEGHYARLKATEQSGDADAEVEGHIIKVRAAVPQEGEGDEPEVEGHWGRKN